MVIQCVLGFGGIFGAGAEVEFGGVATAANQAIEHPFFDVEPVFRAEEAELALGESVVGTGQAGFERQIDEVRLREGDTVRADTVADECRMMWVNTEVFDEFAYQLSFVLVEGDDDIVEDGSETALPNLVLLNLTASDRNSNEQEVVTGTSEDR